MQTRLYLPTIALQPYIQGYMYSSVGNSGSKQKLELDLFPVGHGMLAFILDEEHFLFNPDSNRNYNVRFNFTGQLDRYIHLNTSSASIVYAAFKPYGAFRLLGIPQHLLTNECTSINDLLGNFADEVFSKMEAHNHEPLTVIRILETWLLQQLQRNERANTDRIAYVCNEIIAHNGSLAIKKLYDLSCMSKSSLEQHFKEQVGLSPKMFSRVIRFNCVNKFLKDTATKDWQELVERYGYFDQPHFIHEFKHFFGYSPSQIHLSHQNLSDHISTMEFSEVPIS